MWKGQVPVLTIILSTNTNQLTKILKKDKINKMEDKVCTKKNWILNKQEYLSVCIMTMKIIIIISRHKNTKMKESLTKLHKEKNSKPAGKIGNPNK